MGHIIYLHVIYHRFLGIVVHVFFPHILPLVLTWKKHAKFRSDPQKAGE